MLIIKSGKRHTTEGIELSNQEKTQNTQRKGNFQILRNIGHGHHQTRGDERKKIKNNTSGERENYSKSSKGQMPGLSTS